MTMTETTPTAEVPHDERIAASAARLAGIAPEQIAAAVDTIGRWLAMAGVPTADEAGFDPEQYAGEALAAADVLALRAPFRRDTPALSPDEWAAVEHFGFDRPETTTEHEEHDHA